MLPAVICKGGVPRRSRRRPARASTPAAMASAPPAMRALAQMGSTRPIPAIAAATMASQAVNPTTAAAPRRPPPRIPWRALAKT